MDEPVLKEAAWGW